MMHLATEIFSRIALFLWKHLRMIIVLLLLFIAELAFLISEKEQEQFEIFNNAQFQLENCEGMVYEDTYRFEITVKNTGGAASRIPEGELKGEQGTNYYLIQTVEGQENEYFLNESDIMVPPGQHVTYFLQMDKYDYENYQEDAESIGDLTLHLEYGYDEVEKIPVTFDS